MSMRPPAMFPKLCFRLDWTGLDNYLSLLGVKVGVKVSSVFHGSIGDLAVANVEILVPPMSIGALNDVVLTIHPSQVPTITTNSV
jgi:hypothetical protein